jgi:hypothetical protein
VGRGKKLIRFPNHSITIRVYNFKIGKKREMGRIDGSQGVK